MFTLHRVEGTKDEYYRELLLQLHELLDGEKDWLANLANTSSLLYNLIPDINWAGFYLYRGGELVLGPFQGKPACIRIAIDRGVCGAVARSHRTIVVPDVMDFPGHIACDPESKSEIVIPLTKGTKLIGVLDIDSSVTGKFDYVDQRYLEEVVEFLLEQSHWHSCIKPLGI